MTNELIDIAELEKRFGKVLPQDFYLRSSLEVAPDLLGAVIVTSKDGKLTAGRITETEAYPADDAASHAYMRDIPTPRTQMQYLPGGHLYMYLIMGLHQLTSIVTSEEGVPDVVFIRSIEPIEGVETMRERRGYSKNDLRGVASGPGRLSRALDLSTQDNSLVVFDPQSPVMILKPDDLDIEIETGGRINLGVHRAIDEVAAEQAIKQPWRYFIAGSEFLS